MVGTRCFALARPAAGTGHWKSVYTRFRRWSRAGVWERLFRELSADPDFEYVLVDATISKVHADATSQNGGLRLTPSAALGVG